MTKLKKSVKNPDVDFWGDSEREAPDLFGELFDFLNSKHLSPGVLCDAMLDVIAHKMVGHARSMKQLDKMLEQEVERLDHHVNFHLMCCDPLEDEEAEAQS
jgi:hypothetical protein